MADVIRMPRMSDTMEEGNIVEWLKKVGDTVEPGDVLAEVETDKATMELESYQDGVLLYIGVESGPVPVDGILAVIGEKGEEYATVLAEAENSTKAVKDDQAIEKTVEEPIAVASSNQSDSTNVPTSSEDSRIKVSPLARSMAKEAKIDLSFVKGTGENNRIVKKDIEAYIASPTKSAPASSRSVSISIPDNSLADFQYGDVPVNQMRKSNC